MSRFTYLLIAVFVFVITLIVMAPASPVHSAFKDDLEHAVPGLRIEGISGTVWQGQATVTFDILPPVNARWKLSPLHLLTGSASTTIRLEGNGLRADIESIASADEINITSLSASITSGYLNQVTLRYGLDLSGEVQLADASLSARQQQILNATGDLNWNGGVVNIETPEQVHVVTLPPLDGKLGMSGNNLNLRVTQNGNEMINVALKPDGWAEVAIAYGFMDLAGLPIPGSDRDRNPSEPAILLEEKIL